MLIELEDIKPLLALDNNRSNFSECQKCGYPGMCKGIYTPGMRCPGCGFLDDKAYTSRALSKFLLHRLQQYSSNDRIQITVEALLLLLNEYKKNHLL